MKIMDFLSKKAISADLKSADKEGVIKELIELLIKTGSIKGKKEDLVKVLMAREALGSTGIGQGIGIPHGKSPHAKSLVAAFGLSKNGVDFESLDDEPVNVIVLLLSNQKEAGLHLKTLAQLAKLFKDKLFIQQLKSVTNSEQAIALINKQQGVLLR